MNGALNKVIAKQHEAMNNKINVDKAKYKNDWFFDPTKYEFFEKDSPNMDLLTHAQVEEFRLYYVAVTRAKFTILNAEWLSEPDLFTSFSSMSNRGSF